MLIARSSNASFGQHYASRSDPPLPGGAQPGAFPPSATPPERAPRCRAPCVPGGDPASSPRRLPRERLRHRVDARLHPPKVCPHREGSGSERFQEDQGPASRTTEGKMAASQQGKRCRSSRCVRYPVKITRSGQAMLLRGNPVGVHLPACFQITVEEADFGQVSPPLPPPGSPPASVPRRRSSLPGLGHRSPVPRETPPWAREAVRALRAAAAAGAALQQEREARSPPARSLAEIMRPTKRSVASFSHSTAASLASRSASRALVS